MSLLLKNNVFKLKMLNQIDLAPCHGNPDLGQKGPNFAVSLGRKPEETSHEHDQSSIIKSKIANFSLEKNSMSIK